MTEQDKKILLRLAVFVLIFGFVYLNIMIFNKIDEQSLEIDRVENEKMLMEDKVMRLSTSKAAAEASAKSAIERLTAYYPMMKSQEVDREITELILREGMTVETLNIAMPEEALWIIPYPESEMTRTAGEVAEAVEEPAEVSAAENTAMAENTAGDELGEENVEQPASNAPPGATTQVSTIYAAKVTLTIPGVEEQFWKLIEKFNTWDKAIRVTYFNIAKGSYLGDDQQWLTLDLEVYMCEGDMAEEK